MKNLILTIALVTTCFSLFAQSTISPFHSSAAFANTDPEIHANGIFRYFVESDNLLRFGDPQQAILILDNAIAENPFFVESYFKRAHLLFRVGEVDRGLEDLETAQRMNPYVSGFFSPGRRIYKKELLNWDTAYYRSMIQEIYGEEGEVVTTLHAIIEAQVKGDIGTARTMLEESFAQEDQPSAVLYGLRANIALILKDYDQAIIDYTRAIKKRPDAANFYFNRGFAKLYTYNREAACNDLETSDQMGHSGSAIKLTNFCYN